VSLYKVTFAKSAGKDFDCLDKTTNYRISKKIDALREAPRPPGCVKLSGSVERWRIRVGDYRVVYDIYDKEKRLDIVAVSHRREVYKFLH